MNAVIPGQVFPDSVILLLALICAALALWAHAAPRPISQIIFDAARIACDAVRGCRRRIRVRTMP